MPNLFDSANYPRKEPTELVVGDRWVWKRTDLGADYPPASYSLKYSLRLEGAGSDEIEINAGESGTDYVVEVESTVTVAYIAGRYHWQAYITRTSDSQRLTIGRGSVQVKPNRDASTTDPRSHARKVLDAIEAVIEGRASKDQEEYSIGSGGSSRSLKRTPIPELLRLKSVYQQAVNGEEAALKLENGTGLPRRVQVRF